MDRPLFCRNPENLTLRSQRRSDEQAWVLPKYMRREGAAQDSAQSPRINVQELCDPRGWPLGSSAPGHLRTRGMGLLWTRPLQQSGGVETVVALGAFLLARSSRWGLRKEWSTGRVPTTVSLLMGLLLVPSVVLGECIERGGMLTPHPVPFAGQGLQKIVFLGVSCAELLLAVVVFLGSSGLVLMIKLLERMIAAGRESEGPDGQKDSVPRPAMDSGTDYYMGEIFVDVETQTEPEPWGPEELVAFAASMAKQVGMKLSQKEEQVKGVVDRFAGDLRRLSCDSGVMQQQEVAMGAWQHDTEDMFWWPMWWCPGQPQWAPAVPGDEVTAGDESGGCGEVDGTQQAQAALVQTGLGGPSTSARRRCKKKKEQTSSVEPQAAGTSGELPDCLRAPSSSGGLSGDEEDGPGSASSEEGGWCGPCGGPTPQNQPTVCGGPTSPVGQVPSRATFSVVASSPLNFLTPAELGQVGPAARGLRGCGEAVPRPALWEPVPDLHSLAMSGQYGACTECDPGRAVVAREFVELAIGDALHGMKGWLDFGQVYEDMDVLQCAILSGEAGRNVAVREEILTMYLRLSKFLVDAAAIKGLWEEATSQANHEGEDFVQQAIGLGRGLPEWEAWQACEPLECEIRDFVGRVYGRVDACRLEVSGNFRLLAETAGDQILQLREWRQYLLSAEPELIRIYVPTAGTPGALASGSQHARGRAVAPLPRVRT